METTAGTDVRIRSLTEFRAQLEALRSEIDSAWSPIFRGQSDADWKLEATLERFSTRRFSFAQYMRILECVVVQLPALRTNYDAFEHDPVPRNWHALRLKPRHHDTMIHLRHLGFPSPLLDWSRSPYIALYFALRDAVPGRDAAVFVFQGDSGVYYEDEPFISTFSPLVAAHRRHHTQQAQYTICHSDKGGISHFRAHEEAGALLRLRSGGLRKIIISGDERDAMLSELHLMNVSDGSLFGTDEGLCRTLAQEVIPRSPTATTRLFPDKPAQHTPTTSRRCKLPKQSA